VTGGGNARGSNETALAEPEDREEGRRRNPAAGDHGARHAEARTAPPPPRRVQRVPIEFGLATAPIKAGIVIARDAVFRRVLAVADLAAAAGGLIVLAAVTGQPINEASLATLPLIVLIAKVAGRYDHDEIVIRKSTLDEAPRLLTLAGAYALAWSLATLPFGLLAVREDVLVLWAATAGLLIVARSAGRRLAQLSAPVERVLIIGNSVGRTRLARRLSSDPAARVDVVGFLPLEDERRAGSDWGPRSRRRRALSVQDLGAVVRDRRIDRVVVVPTSADSETMLDALSRATAVGVKVSIVPRILEVVGSAVEFDAVAGVTVLGVRRPGLGRSSRAVKRAMDVCGAALGLVALAPFGALLALLIKLDSPGPVFFRQLRVGRAGQIFEMIKFRSMVDGAHAQRQALMALNESDGLFKLTADPRVTRVGRLLRRSSLDELPQLINVLRGEMSLVGPRPLVIEEDSQVEGRHRDRLQLAPGMTGPWQILGPTRVPLSEMVKIDYLYRANWSLWTDVKILLRTVAHVAARRGL
jgi:exopolysaccharide biosynthesis polyprenyl glycosylphosphotransferase